MKTRHNEAARLPDHALYLTLDQGGHASRALVFDASGKIIASDFQPIAVNYPQPDRVEHDPHELITSLRTAINNVITQLGTRSTDIVAAGLATQRSSLACWDKTTGAALSPIISWQDRRAHHQLQQFESQRQAIHQKTGLFLNAHYGASKLRWCLDHLPAVRAAQHNGTLACGPLASFVLFHLLEERPLFADPANASRTLLWNISTGDWDDALLTLFGVPHTLLPRCVPTRHSFGHLRINDFSIPLTVTNGDQSAALFAFGTPQADIAYINVGTGAFVQRVSQQRPHHARLLSSVVMQTAEHTTYTLEGTINGASSALQWASNTLGLSNIEPSMENWLTQHITHASTRSTAPLLFLNGVSGLGAPYWIADFHSQFIGAGEAWEKMVAVVESIVFLLHTNLCEMESACPAPRTIVISGGLATLNGLCQRLADLCGLPVYRPAECEATARGTAFLLAGSETMSDHWSLHNSEHSPEYMPDTIFTPAPNPALQERYRLWQHAMPKYAETIGHRVRDV